MTMDSEQSDRELLELAAKAAGIELFWGSFDGGTPITAPDGIRWNPLIDDGDALRLAVKLRIHLSNSGTDAWAITGSVTAIGPLGTDPYAATRRAIVRAAAAIGAEV